MDSGANYHITPNPEQLEEIVLFGKSHLTTCMDEQSQILGISSTIIHCTRSSKLFLKEVLYIPYVTKSLMSINKLTRNNSVHVNFTN